MKRAKHSLSNYKLASMNMGQLTPVGVVPVVRGDTLKISSSALVRMSPQLAPTMHPVHARIHHWFVPNRLVWSEWEAFITGGGAGAIGSGQPVHPTLLFGPGGRPNTAIGDLMDYMGVPPLFTGSISALPFRAYQLIYNEFYRDQDLILPRIVNTGSGLDTTTDLTLNNAAWNKDYFTTCRPEPQEGPEVTVPITLDGTMAVVGNTSPLQLSPGNAGAAARTTTLGVNTSGSYSTVGYGGSGVSPAQTAFYPSNPAASGLETTLDDPSDFNAEFSVRDLRLSAALQRFSEARSQFGSRYTEFLSYYGIKSSDARLQRPEYLGGAKQTIQFSEVLQTAPGDDSSVGDLFGHGIGAVKSKNSTRFFEEDGFVISLMIVNPVTMYTDGLNRAVFNYRLKEDYFQKELAHIGQQQVLNKEVYAFGTDEVQNAPFGYQDRYDELRFIPNTIAGEFRQELDYWHMARKFNSLPALNGTFVTSNPTNRTFADTNVDQLQVMVRHNIIGRRIVPKYGKTLLK